MEYIKVTKENIEVYKLYALFKKKVANSIEFRQKYHNDIHNRLP